MSRVFRLFVEKRPGFDVEAQNYAEQIRGFLKIESLEKLRIFYRYDVQGIEAGTYLTAKNTVFSEPPQDTVRDEELPDLAGYTVIATEYLPGQYDQRSDSAAQCIRLINHHAEPLVRSAKIFALKGRLSGHDINTIKKFIINPVDSREAQLEKPAGLEHKAPVPKEVRAISGFLEMSGAGIKALGQNLDLAMGLDDLLFIQHYFKNTEKREPTETEIKMLDTYWSDHCRHTTFLTEIESVEIEDGPYKNALERSLKAYRDARSFVYEGSARADCLMDIATIAMKEMRKRGGLPELDLSEEINACSIKVNVKRNGLDEDWLVMFKNETHNHPTEIEPFGGAATCLGGAIRDPLSGRVYVYQAMRVTGSGDPRRSLDETIPGKLPQRVITTTAAKGYSSYGNQIGLATGIVSEIYDEGYVAKRMEIGAVIGAAPAAHVLRSRPQKGDVVLLIGGRTGRDGIGGATGSSKAHTDKALENEAEVQKGNPPVERKLQRLFRDPGFTRKIKRCNDFGAGGVSVAIGELAPSIDIHLDKVPLKYEGLNGSEIALSESQERMAVVIDKKDIGFVMEKAYAENLEATEVAQITDTGRLRMLWRNKTIVDIMRAFLDTNGTRQKTNVVLANPTHAYPYNNTQKISTESWLENLKDLNVAGQKGLIEQFDSSIGASAVLHPFGGKYRRTPAECMVSLLPAEGASTATAMSWGFDVSLAHWSPYHMAAFAVIESVARLVACGADYKKAYLTLQEYFEKLGDDPQKWGKPYAALLGAYEAQKQLNIAAIGGKDSMSGTFQDLNVPPTLVSFAVAPVEAKTVISAEFKQSGNHVFVVDAPVLEEQTPDYKLIKENFEWLHQKISSGDIIAVHTLGKGGAAAAVSKMCFGNKIGFDSSRDLDWFSPRYGGFVVECTHNLREDALPKHIFEIGKTTAKQAINIKGTILKLEDCLDAWLSPLEKVFPWKHNDTLKSEGYPGKPQSSKTWRASSPVTRPRVFIPVFPGTNCEYDSARAFERAGAEVSTVVFNNLTERSLEDSIEAMASTIENSQIIMIPGGFSAGDEPEGSGKFIASVFRNNRIAQATMDLIQKRDGLILGVCNGFQALIKLGLLPYGEIRSIDSESPTLTFNKLNRHYSQMVDTKVLANADSPWFIEVDKDTIYTIPVSNGEGRFSAPDAVLASLFNNNQVATQYVDEKGNPSMDSFYNPSGSMGAVEGLLSPDGRVFGKMAHTERVGLPHVAKNIPGIVKQEIFKSAVAYFGK